MAAKERGRQAAKPREIPQSGWKDILIRTKQEVARDLRTWWGTVLIAEALQSPDTGRQGAGSKGQTARALQKVARTLGNTVTVCRQYYVHPAVIAAHGLQRLQAAFEWAGRQRPAGRMKSMRVSERAVLRFLQSR